MAPRHRLRAEQEALLSFRHRVAVEVAASTQPAPEPPSLEEQEARPAATSRRPGVGPQRQRSIREPLVLTARMGTARSAVLVALEARPITLAPAVRVALEAFPAEAAAGEGAAPIRVAQAVHQARVASSFTRGEP